MEKFFPADVAQQIQAEATAAVAPHQLVGADLCPNSGDCRVH